jgi:secreted trypsin-like serine protease
MITKWLCSLTLVSIVSALEAEYSDRKLVSPTIGGKVANSSRQPYGALVTAFLDVGSFFCGGSLVAPDMILTSASCLNAPNETILGHQAYVNISTVVNFSGYEHIQKVIKLIPNPSFDSTTFSGDLALVLLEQAVTDVPTLNINRQAEIPKDRQSLSTYGLGMMSFPETADVVMEDTISVVPHKDCNDRTSYNGRIVKNAMICASDPKGRKKNCFGDMGSPLILLGTNPNQDVQVGILSFRNGCPNPDFPTVYTRVSHYLRWIQNTICNHSASKPSSCSSKNPSANPEL